MPVMVDVRDGRLRGRPMADRSGLKLVGFIFATITLAVMLTAATVVKTYADGGYSLESTTVASE